MKNKKRKKKKLCCVASTGGHWEELLCLKEIFDEYDCFYVTEKSGQIIGSKLQPLYLVRQMNRHERFFFIHFFKLILYACKIIWKEKPDVVITTGALISFPFCFIGKIFGKKVVFIESFARIKDRSLTGRLVYPFADLFIVQWESMLKCYPKAIYGGGIF